jgi:hypothetical protein
MKPVISNKGEVSISNSVTEIKKLHADISPAVRQSQAFTVPPRRRLPSPGSIELDEIGATIPADLLPSWQRRHGLQEAIACLLRLRQILKQAQKENNAAFSSLNLPDLTGKVDHILADLKGSVPWAVCQQHSDNKENCLYCHGTGFVSRHLWETVISNPRKMEKVRIRGGAV